MHALEVEAVRPLAGDVVGKLRTEGVHLVEQVVDLLEELDLRLAAGRILVVSLVLGLLELIVLKERVYSTHREIVVGDGPGQPVEVLAHLQELPRDDEPLEAACLDLRKLLLDSNLLLDPVPIFLTQY